MLPTKRMEPASEPAETPSSGARPPSKSGSRWALDGLMGEFGEQEDNDSLQICYLAVRAPSTSIAASHLGTGLQETSLV